MLPAHARSSPASDSEESTDPCAGSLNFSELVLTMLCDETVPAPNTEDFGVNDLNEYPEWVTGVSTGPGYEIAPQAGVFLPDSNGDGEFLRAGVIIDGNGEFQFDQDCGGEDRQESGSFTFPSASGYRTWQLSYLVEFTGNEVTLTLSNLVQV